MNEEKKKTQPHYCGHRQRLKERFLKNPQVLPDYEILELLLYWVYPRQDVKPLAKQMLTQAETLSAVISAQVDPLRRVGPGSFFVFSLLREVLRRMLLPELREQPLLNNAERVIDYCRITMAHLAVEQFRIFFLNRKHVLISDEVQNMGTLDQTALYPREVMRRALELNAAGLILVHNHPSGDPSPSQADIDITRQLQFTLPPFNIQILDHFIVGRHGYFSFREHQLLSR